MLEHMPNRIGETLARVFYESPGEPLLSVFAINGQGLPVRNQYM